MRIRLPIFAAVALVAIVACSDEAPLTAPTDMTLEEALDELNTVGTYAGAGLTTVGISAPGATVPASTVCPLDAATMFFVCPAQTSDGFTANRRYQLLDASGMPLASFDPAMVHGIRNISDGSGTRSGAGGDPTRTITIDSHDEQVLTGLGTANGETWTCTLDLQARGTPPVCS